MLLLGLFACRVAVGAVSGGGLPPAPDTRGDWWALHVESWHALGTGTDVPAPPEVAPLALLGKSPLLRRLPLPLHRLLRPRPRRQFQLLLHLRPLPQSRQRLLQHRPRLLLLRLPRLPLP